MTKASEEISSLSHFREQANKLAEELKSVAAVKASVKQLEQEVMWQNIKQSTCVLVVLVRFDKVLRASVKALAAQPFEITSFHV